MSNSIARISLGLLAASLAGACGTDGRAPLSTQPPSALRSANTGEPVARPWGGRCEFSAERLAPTLIRVSGTCHLSHLGRAEFVNMQTIVPGPVTQFTNSTTYTAANGDVLYTTAVGTATPADGGSRLILAATESVQGGTGRFVNASGQAALEGSTALTGPAARTGYYELTGGIAYAASDASR
jgi:hypothetical protein